MLVKLTIGRMKLRAFFLSGQIFFGENEGDEEERMKLEFF
jgi:hypothetical protein